MQRSAALLLALTIVVGVPAAADAAPRESPYDSRGYVYVAPGVIYIPVGDDDFTDLADVGYQWGLGAGGMLTPGSGNFGVSLGLAFEHAPINLDEDVDDLCGGLVDCDLSVHAFRILPELRIGGGTRTLFAYGLVAPGLGLLHARAHGDVFGVHFDDEDTDAGFNLGLGAGAQVIVWRSLAVGAEFGADLGFFPEQDDDEDAPQDDYGVHTLDLKLLVAWWF